MSFRKFIRMRFGMRIRTCFVQISVVRRQGLLSAGLRPPACRAREARYPRFASAPDGRLKAAAAESSGYPQRVVSYILLPAAGPVNSYKAPVVVETMHDRTPRRGGRRGVRSWACMDPASTPRQATGTPPDRSPTCSPCDGKIIHWRAYLARREALAAEAASHAWKLEVGETAVLRCRRRRGADRPGQYAPMRSPARCARSDRRRRSGSRSGAAGPAPR
jgi:hypothetical protein